MIKPIRHFNRLLPGVAFLALMPWGLALLLPPLNGDVAAILYFATRMVAGQRLYIDLIDFNPPLIFLLNLGPAGFAAWLGLPPAPVFMLSVLLLVGLSIMLSLRLLAGSLPAGRSAATAWLLAVILILLPRQDFGQREHLMVVLALPGIALAAVRLRRATVPLPLALVAAALAAVGYLIKPYFLAVPLLIEIWLLTCLGFRSWYRRPEGAVLLLAGGAYGLVLILVFPAYLADMVPTAAHYYLRTDPVIGLARVFGDDQRWLIPVGLVGLLPLIRRNPEAAMAWCLALGGSLSAAVQGKGWGYHVIPAWSGLALSLSAILARLRWSWSGNGARLAALALLVLMMIQNPPGAAAIAYPTSLVGDLEAGLAVELGPSSTKRTVMWFADGVWPRFPVMLYLGSRPGMADMDLWLLRGLYVIGPDQPARAFGPPNRDEAALIGRAVRAITSMPPPDLVVIEPGPIDYLAYFTRDPQFQAAWRNYRLSTRIGAIQVYKPVGPAG